MYVLTRCKGVICANSTFSWWGAWLNNNTNKSIFIPDKWLNDRNNIVPMKDSTIIPTMVLI